MHRDNLKNCLPPYISNTKTFEAIFNEEGQELDKLCSCLEDIKAQFNIDTANWGLDIYEKELGITTDYTKSLEYRKSVVKSKWRGSGKLDTDLLKMVCSAFANGDVEITFDGTIKIKFVSSKGIPPNFQDLQEAVEQIKPAYLLVQYIIIYNTLNYLHGFTTGYMGAFTCDELKIVNLQEGITQDRLSNFTYGGLEVILNGNDNI